MADDGNQEILAGNAEYRAPLHQQQAQPQQPSIVHWERFLPQRQLCVLLVEDDDSTGHVVSALLRNCGYEVTLASNGLLAWEFLMDRTNQVDLVLTEVAMPNLSGIGLLSRIMNHKPFKHIPVIMMSSHDSMGIVFKCLSKGAVDFLVKPLRKNELKNLWQHIWRRCHTSSGSGCGSGGGSQRQKAALPDVAREDNNSGSNDESDNMSNELNVDGGSDNGSGTQNSWTKKAVEVGSSHHGASGGLRLHSSIQVKNECWLGPDRQNRKDVSLDTNLSVSRVAAVELPFFHNDKVNGNLTPNVVRITIPNTGGIRQLEEGVDSALPHVNQQTANVVNEISVKEQGRFDEQQADSDDAADLLEKHASNSSGLKDKTSSDSSSPFFLKLSLKRPSQAEIDKEGEVRGTLKRSCSSAFSRYNSSGNITPLPAGTISCNPPASGFGDHSFVHGSSVGSNHHLSIPLSSRMDRPPFMNVGTDEVPALPFFRGSLHVSSNRNSGGVAHTILSGKQNAASCFTKEEGTHLKARTGRQIHFLPSPVMPIASGSCKELPILADANLAPHWVLSSENVEVEECHVPHQPNQDHQNAHTKQDVRVHHHHHHHHHHVQHHYHDHQDRPQETLQQEDLSVIDVGASAPKCGSSNMEKCPADNNWPSGSFNGYGSNGNGAVSLNGSATGSNGGQSAAAAEAVGVGNVDSSTQLGAAGSGLTAAHGFPLGADESRHARREAALTKFRRKRKERCFEKKVRYQSRKRLAEQRPRVRGQFVKQSVG